MKNTLCSLLALDIMLTTLYPEPRSANEPESRNNIVIKVSARSLQNLNHIPSLWSITLHERNNGGRDMNQAMIVLQRREAVSRGSFLKEVMTRNMLMHNRLRPLYCALNEGECRSAISLRQAVHSKYGGALRKWRHCPENIWIPLWSHGYSLW